MTIEEMPAALVDIENRLVEKLGGQPAIETDLRCRQSGKWRIMLWKRGPRCEVLKSLTGDSPAAVFLLAREFIASIPDLDTVNKREWQGKLAKVIDEGHALNLPSEVMEPLCKGSQAMTENLLAAPTVTA